MTEHQEQICLLIKSLHYFHLEMQRPSLLPDDVKLEYLAEGAANIVYRILLPPGKTQPQKDSVCEPTSIWAHTADLHALPSRTSTSTPPPTDLTPPVSPSREPPEILDSQSLKGYLLRLHKAVPWIPSYTTLHETYLNHITPLFQPGHLINQRLVTLPPNLIPTANRTLQIAETAKWLSTPQTTTSQQIVHPMPRPKPRHGRYLDETETMGLLVEDMSPRPIKDEVLIEVKPKWLAQSADAPTGARRCRTCALRAKRAAEKRIAASLKTGGVAAPASEPQINGVEAATQTPSQMPPSKTAGTMTSSGAYGRKPTFCPLDLVSSRREDVERAVEGILAPSLIASHELQLRDPTIFQTLQGAVDGYLFEGEGRRLLEKLAECQRVLDPKGVLEQVSGGYTDGVTNAVNGDLSSEPLNGDISANRQTETQQSLQDKLKNYLRGKVEGEIPDEQPNGIPAPQKNANHDSSTLPQEDIEDHQQPDGPTLPKTPHRKPDMNFLTATTLRDCTLFLLITILPPDTKDSTPSNPNDDSATSKNAVSGTNSMPNGASFGTSDDTFNGMRITAKLGDLDLKEPEEEKLAYWAGIERSLVEEGWYEGLDGEVVGCMLER